MDVVVFAGPVVVKQSFKTIPWRARESRPCFRPTVCVPVYKDGTDRLRENGDEGNAEGEDAE